MDYRELDFRSASTRARCLDAGMTGGMIALIVWLDDQDARRTSDGTDTRRRKASFADVVRESSIKSKSTVSAAAHNLIQLGILNVKVFYSGARQSGTVWVLSVSQLREFLADPHAAERCRTLTNADERHERCRTLTNADERHERHERSANTVFHRPNDSQRSARSAPSLYQREREKESLDLENKQQSIHHSSAQPPNGPQRAGIDRSAVWLPANPGTLKSLSVFARWWRKVIDDGATLRDGCAITADDDLEWMLACRAAASRPDVDSPCTYFAAILSRPRDQISARWLERGRSDMAALPRLISARADAIEQQPSPKSRTVTRSPVAACESLSPAEFSAAVARCEPLIKRLAARDGRASPLVCQAVASILEPAARPASMT